MSQYFAFCSPLGCLPSSSQSPSTSRSRNPAFRVLRPLQRLPLFRSLPTSSFGPPGDAGGNLGRPERHGDDDDDGDDDGREDDHRSKFGALLLLQQLRGLPMAIGRVYMFCIPIHMGVVVVYSKFRNAACFMPRHFSGKRSKELEGYVKVLAPELEGKVHVYAHRDGIYGEAITVPGEGGIMEMYADVGLVPSREGRRAMIAHEVAHIVEKHGDELEWWSYFGMVWWLAKRPWFGIASAVGLLRRNGINRLVNTLDQWIDTFDNEILWVILGKRRWFELEADARAMRLMDAAGWDLNKGIIGMYNVIREADLRIGTHPSKAERMRRIEQTAVEIDVERQRKGPMKKTERIDKNGHKKERRSIKKTWKQKRFEKEFEEKLSHAIPIN